MQRYIIVRLGHSLLALLAISIIIFGLTRVTGNPVDVLLPEEATAEDIQYAEELWGLDKPLHLQYIKYLGNIFKVTWATPSSGRAKTRRT